MLEDAAVERLGKAHGGAAAQHTVVLATGCRAVEVLASPIATIIPRATRAPMTKAVPSVAVGLVPSFLLQRKARGPYRSLARARRDGEDWRLAGEGSAAIIASVPLSSRAWLPAPAGPLQHL